MGKSILFSENIFYPVSLSLAKPFDESHTSAEVYIIVMCLGFSLLVDAVHGLNT